MPTVWRYAMVVLVVCLLASLVIGTVRLVNTPTQILGAGFKGWHGTRFPR